MMDNMIRESMCINIPQEYLDNEEKGLCKVCAKPKSEFEKYMRKYCSIKCNLEFQKCFVGWEALRKKLIQKNPFCARCRNKDRLEVDHIMPIALKGDMWSENNLQVLCSLCHIKKTAKDRIDISIFKKISLIQKKNKSLTNYEMCVD